MISASVVVVGAGPAGLATGARLRRAGIDFEILEAEDRVAPAWHRHYERLHLHTVKETSHLPFKPFEDEDPRYIPRARLVEYFREYAEEMDLEPRLGEEVVEISGDGELWHTRTASGNEYLSPHVVVATGFNRVPHRPTWQGMETFRGEILHSREYRRPDPFRDRDVLVVGMGNTGAEIALDLVESGARPTLSVRSPVNIVPRDILGRPTQLTAMTLDRLPDPIGDAIGVLLRRLTVGDLSRWGIETPEDPPAAQLRKYGKTPVIDVGTLEKIKEGAIGVRPGVDAFLAEGVRFTDGSEEPFEAVVLATGYRSKVEELIPAADGDLLNELGHPEPGSADGIHRGLHFVGFDGYAVGGILRTIHRDSEVVVDAIRASR